MAWGRDNAAPRIAYANDTHREFNERLAGNDKRPRPDPLLTGPWMSSETLLALPKARRDFDQGRVPPLGGRRDARKTEADRRGAGTGRGSGMVKGDAPFPAPHPPPDIRRPVDEELFSSRWLVEQRDAVLAAAAVREKETGDSPHRGRSPRAPSR